MAQATRRETRLEQLQRLGEKGACEGVTVGHIIGAPNTWAATSASDPGGYYLITVYPDRRGTCTCPGYAKHEACKHYALALMAAGIMAAPEWMVTGPDRAA